MAGASTSAQQRWELENDVRHVSEVDALYTFDAAEQQAIQQQRPWSKDPQYFQQCAPLLHVL